MSEIDSWLTLREQWQKTPLSRRKSLVSKYSDAELEAVNWWLVNYARANQLPPAGEWVYWVILAGRGFGKTRTGAETVRLWAKDYRMINLIGATADDARDIMIEGESGILAICPAAERPVYKKSDRKLVWPTGATSLIFTADEPDRLRGKQSDKLWADELCAWRYVSESWDQAMLGLRLGANPQAIITTTPRPIKQLKEILKDKGTVVTRGSTYDNRRNLAPSFFSKITSRFEGTRLGRQELFAEVLEDIEGALWTYAMLDQYRVNTVPELRRTIVAVDPAVSANKDSDETGIIGGAQGIDDHKYILADASGIYSPLEWAQKAIHLYMVLGADAIVAEVNQGGDLVEANLRAAGFTGRVIKVHASKGKVARAEPVVGLYEQGKVHHVGNLAGLESQMTTWSPKDDDSPDRVDALVWLNTELMNHVGGRAVLDPFSDW
jgi:phage terminase large subunit-like protein